MTVYFLDTTQFNGFMFTIKKNEKKEEKRKGKKKELSIF